MTRTQAEELKATILGEVSGFARRDSGVDKILDILIQAGIIEHRTDYSGNVAVRVNSIHSHDDYYESLGEKFLGDEIKG